MENNNKQLVEKLVNVFVNHEIYKENRETAIETLNRYRWVLYNLDLLPEEVDKKVQQRVNELRAK